MVVATMCVRTLDRREGLVAALRRAVQLSAVPTMTARCSSPDEALYRPRLWCAHLVRHRGRLGLPDPDPRWERTAQVNWRGSGDFTPGFLVRLVCLYFGHHLVERQVRDFPAPSAANHYAHLGDLKFRRDCVRCGWEGPWTR